MHPPGKSRDAIYVFGPFRLDAAARVLFRDGRIVAVPPKALDTLIVLIENRGRLVQKDELLRTIWPDTYVDPNSLMHNVSVLRKVLGEAPDGKSYIETAPRRGYGFMGTVQIPGTEPELTGGPPEVRRNKAWAPAAAVIVSLAVIAALIWIKAPASPPFVITPLTSYPGTEAYPTFSPDGREVTFVWNGEQQQQFDLYVKRIGSEPPRRVTDDREPECHPQWSPDGNWIAFLYCGDEGVPEVSPWLSIIPSSGGAKRKIVSIHEGGNPSDRPFTWAGGKALITAEVIGGSPRAGLFLVPIEAPSQGRQLTRPPAGNWDTDPAISPDGKTLAFVRWVTHGLSDIYLVRIDRQFMPGGEPVRLTFEKDFITNLVWTNSGSEILYVAGNGGGRGVWRVPARPGASPRQAQSLSDAGIHIALSREGKLAYSRRYWDYDIWRAELDGGTVARSVAPWVVSTYLEVEPRYSPDGRSIAFQSNRSGAMEIWRVAADGSHATQVTSLRAEAGSPAWSPDGTRIAFDCRLNGNVDIYVAGVSDGRVRRLTTDPGVHTTPSWSSDGQWIYFGSKRTGRLEVWKVPSGGGEPVQVTQNGGFFASESVDGRTLYYSKTAEFPTALWMRSFETGKEEQIIGSLRHWAFFQLFAGGIYFVPNDGPVSEPANFQVAFYDLATRVVRNIADIRKPPGVGFAISPDRRTVLFAPPEVHGSDLMLVENFR